MGVSEKALSLSMKGFVGCRGAGSRCSLMDRLNVLFAHDCYKNNMFQSHNPGEMFSQLIIRERIILWNPSELKLERNTQSVAVVAGSPLYHVLARSHKEVSFTPVHRAFSRFASRKGGLAFKLVQYFGSSGSLRSSLLSPS